MKKLVIEVPDDCVAVTFTFVQAGTERFNVMVEATKVSDFADKTLVANKDWKVCYFKDKRSK